MLRPLRLLRLLALARTLNPSAASSLVGARQHYVLGAGMLAVGLGAVMLSL